MHVVWRALITLLIIIRGINVMFPQSLYFESKEQKSAEFDWNNVVLMVCDEAYCGAVANLIVSLRIDGGHEGDIAVIVEPSKLYKEFT